MARRRYQKGRVFLRGTKKRVWVGRWREDLVLADGSIRRVERSAILGDERELKTKRLAQRRLDLTLARINAPEYRPGRVASIAEFAEKWQAEILIHRKPSTVKAAKSHLKIYILPQLGRMQLDELGREPQQAFATRLVSKVSRKTVVNILGTLSTMLATAKEWGYISESVRLGSLALPEAPLSSGARFFSGEEAKKIIAVAMDPYRTMFATVAAMAGLRAGEILGLMLEDIDFERKLLHIRRSAYCGQIQTVKSKSSRAPLPMPDALAEILRAVPNGMASQIQRSFFSQTVLDVRTTRTKSCRRDCGQSSRNSESSTAGSTRFVTRTRACCLKSVLRRQWLRPNCDTVMLESLWEFTAT